ncbi:hypothetical protein IEO21_10783 [Rhodonia placenta]|uniref:Uncharacterized protein n=1 Tax=Rhodonia placenta TaxID=104341 RepID=A0A8H7NRW6_9APHY|nr:hypothetical protein IEO21_10783 [Postia placenta]
MEVGLSASSISGDATESHPLTRRRLPWTADDSSISDTESHAASDRATAAGEDELTRNLKGMPFLITPESSVLNHPLSSSDDASGTATDSQTRLGQQPTRRRGCCQKIWYVVPFTYLLFRWVDTTFVSHTSIYRQP